MNNWRLKFMRFMQGRRGADEFSKFLSITSLVFMVLSYLLGFRILYIIAFAIVIYIYFRIMSKNISKRYKENQMFLERRYNITNKFNKFKRYFKERKTHKFYKCEKCGQTLRVPKGKGKIRVTCPKCKNEFRKIT